MCNFPLKLSRLMHEMSIAMNIVEIVSTTVQKNHAKKVNSIDLEIGELAGILVDSLTFCFDAACKGTIAEGAVLNINEIKALGKCLDCDNEFPVEMYFAICSKCGGAAVDIIQGKELAIKSINVD